MNLAIFKMEIKRLRKTLLVGILAPACYSLLIMIFYVSFADIFKDMAGMFESASIKGLLSAFSMDSQTFSYILNYYVSYNSVYMLIMGISFAVVIAGKLFSKELRDGTYEFIYANPISRSKIFFSKISVVVLYLLMVNILVFGIGYTSIELLKTNSPIIPWESQENVQMLRDKLALNPSGIEVFERDDALFYSVIFSSLENQFTLEQGMESVDDDLTNELLGTFLVNPDSIFDVQLNNPGKYMSLYSMKEGDEESFKALIEQQKKAYFMSKSSFKENPIVVSQLFKTNPTPFLQQVISDQRLDAFKASFALDDTEYDQLFVYYSFTNFCKISLTTFLAMLTIALFITTFIVAIPNGRMTGGIATGIAFVFYFLNMIGSIAEPAAFLKYFTPLSYVNMDVMNVNYQTETWSFIVMFTVIILSVFISLMTFRKGDFKA